MGKSCIRENLETLLVVLVLVVRVIVLVLEPRVLDNNTATR